MIRVNLAGTPKKKSGKAAAKAAGPSNFMPLVHLLILVGTAVAGYLWYSQLTNKTADLNTQIAAKEAYQEYAEVFIQWLHGDWDPQNVTPDGA